jgi:hypothetical protein
MYEKEHPESLWPMYDLITEAQTEGHACMLVCRPGSKPSIEQLKAKGVVMEDLLVSIALDGSELRRMMEIGINCDTLRTFVI